MAEPSRDWPLICGIVLAMLALGLATIVGLPLGVMTGADPRGAFAAVVAPISTALVACPPVIGALGLLLLAVSTGFRADGLLTLQVQASGLRLEGPEAVRRFFEDARAAVHRAMSASPRCGSVSTRMACDTDTNAPEAG